MAPKKDPEEELKDAAAKALIRRPRRTYCEACKLECGTPLMLRRHMQTQH